MFNGADDAKSPGLFSLIIETPFYLLIGALIGIVMLIYTPITMVETVEEFDALGPNKTYLIPHRMERNQQYEVALARMRAANAPEIAIPEGHLNSWASDTFEDSKTPGKAFRKIEMGAPRFLLGAGKVRVVAPIWVSFLNHEPRHIYLQFTGDLDSKGGVTNFHLEQTTLGSLRADRIPFLEDILWGIVWDPVAESDVFDDIRSIFAKSLEVSVVSQSRSLLFRFKGRTAEEEERNVEEE